MPTGCHEDVLEHLHTQEFAGHLLGHLGSTQHGPDGRPTSYSARRGPPTSHNLMDLTDIMVLYVDGPSIGCLYEVVVSMFANDADGAHQKKAYKVVNSMAETETGRVALKSSLEELMRNILDTTAAATATATATAKRARLSLISHVVSLMDPAELYFVPSILSEVIVATKEVNELHWATRRRLEVLFRVSASATWKEHPAKLRSRSVNTLAW